jgi:hypothetical protein
VPLKFEELVADAVQGGGGGGVVVQTRGFGVKEIFTVLKVSPALSTSVAVPCKE